MNKMELIGRFASYGILGALGGITSFVGYLEIYEQSGFLLAFVFFMINTYLMVRGISIIVEEKSK